MDTVAPHACGDRYVDDEGRCLRCALAVQTEYAATLQAKFTQATRDLAAMERERDELRAALTVARGFLKRCEAERDAAEQELDELRAALDKYGQHVHSGPIASVCDLTMIDAYDPDHGFKVRGKWQVQKPKCTCGLDDAIEETL